MNNQEVAALQQQVARLTVDNASLKASVTRQQSITSKAVQDRLKRAEAKHNRQLAELEQKLIRRDQTISGLRAALNDRKDNSNV